MKEITMGLKVLFVHVPHFRKQTFSIGLPPIGYFAMAELLNRHGFDAQIIHLGLEKILGPDFDLAKEVDQNGFDVVCFAIHWHYQLWDTLCVIKSLKKRVPQTKIVVGGFTASYFARQLMQGQKQIDFIICGEGEIPLLSLVKNLCLSKPKNLGGVPNLVWRSGGSVVKNKLTYVATQKDLDDLNFSCCDLMRHFDLLTRLTETGYSYSSNCNFVKDVKTFMLCPGRGCSVNCFYCGGGKRAQKLISNRNCHVFRSPRKVVADIKRIIKYGINNVFMDYDPEPNAGYYDDLFAEIKRSKIKVLGNFASWALPSKDFIKKFRETFLPNSILIISPDVGSERVRKLTKGFYFSNSELFGALDFLKDKSLATMVYFFMGTPFETAKEVEQTFALKEQIAQNYPFTTPMIYFPEIEPGADFYQRPGKYKVKVLRHGLQDFCNYSKRMAKVKDLGKIGVEEQMGFRSLTLSAQNLLEITRCHQQKIPLADVKPSALRLETRLRFSRDCSIKEFLAVAGKGLELRTSYLATNQVHGVKCELDEIDSKVLELVGEGTTVADILKRLPGQSVQFLLLKQAVTAALCKLLRHHVLEISK
ncbi:hypothetical protein COT42_07810 [Candidatus Saganbacteria bacterium CG08_land_8_20_14_0_20_45_16]|uniref:B12-binding domain-containing protein n=1 Tax=Candidatus Saganbacteria bacterium CG08_land_8_20_14_0_20_45_16 TaxID=2014293 RepID=A0A2H0XWL9_UNCSA|nr:MAG: hypothetical protein COT42_07810 [Candidatus Saganbacteria bacterium CG08_land_8_20_14_0_20_45_16]